jgi:hypothetical protein
MTTLSQPEMTAREFSDAVTKLAAGMGPRGSISTFIMDRLCGADGAPLYSAVYPTGDYSRGPEFTVTAETFAELHAGLRDKIAAHAEVYRTRTIRKMALAIIRITGELGHCTDAALRNCGEFDPEQVTAFGELACTDANEVAGKGPFTIVALGGANGAEAA